MARIGMTMDDVRAEAAGDVDPVVLREATEEDIRRHAIEDGESDDDQAGAARVVIPPATVRAKTGLSQDDFARALGIPVNTLRDWEGGRTSPDPVANSLLVLINADPETMLTLLRAPAA